MGNNYRVIGVTDDKDFCQCCGRTGLKRVVWIENTESGDIKHFGTTCAVAPAKGFGVVHEVKAAIDRFTMDAAALMHTTHHEYRCAGGKYEKVNAFTSRPVDRALFAASKQAAAARFLAFDQRKAA